MTAAAIAHGTVPFPVGEVHGSQFTALDAILGEEFIGEKGKVYRLYTSTAAVASPASLCFFRTAAGGTAVTIGAATTPVCGVAVADQVALAAGDYFFLQVDGEMVLTGKTSHGVANVGDGVKPAANGEVEVSGTTNTTTVDLDLPLVVHTIASNVLTAYPAKGKLWGFPAD